LITHYLNLPLESTQRQVIVRLLLEYAHLETLHQLKSTYRLNMEQSERHVTYVNYLFNVWKDWILNTKPNAKYATLPTTFETWAFSTVSHSAFRYYAPQFYHNGTKRVLRVIYRLLTARGLAYLYKADGSSYFRESKGVILNA
jgi:hypothetical protein